MRYLIALAIALFLVPSTTFAAIAFDTSKTGGSGVATSPLYYTMTLGGTDTAICVANQGGVSASDTTTNVQIGTIAGTSTATKEGGVQTPSDRFSDLWCLLNPPTGTVTVRVDFTGTFLTSLASAFSGVGAIDAAITKTTGAATTFSISNTTLQNNAWVLAEGDNANATPSAGAATTVRQGATGMALGDSNAAITPAGSATLNFSSVSGTWSGVMVALEPPAAAVLDAANYLTHSIFF